MGKPNKGAQQPKGNAPANRPAHVPATVPGKHANVPGKQNAPAPAAKQDLALETKPGTGGQPHGGSHPHVPATPIIDPIRRFFRSIRDAMLGE